MASESKCLLHFLNALHLVFGLGIVVTSLWFFVEVQQFTSLRNYNHYLLDYNVYWPQAIPWLFFIVGVLAICVSGLGFAGVRKSSKGLLKFYNIVMAIVIFLLVGAAIIALIFADSKTTDSFIIDTIWDAYFHSKTDTDVAGSFGIIEKRLHCCGAEGPRDYKNWKNEFPTSCCDTYYHGWIGSYQIDCDFTNKLANERHGCSAVATQYAKIAIRVLSGLSCFTGLIGILALVLTVVFYRGLNRKPRVTVSESESKKVLL